MFSSVQRESTQKTIFSNGVLRSSVSRIYPRSELKDIELIKRRYRRNVLLCVTTASSTVVCRGGGGIPKSYSNNDEFVFWIIEHRGRTQWHGIMPTLLNKMHDAFQEITAYHRRKALFSDFLKLKICIFSNSNRNRIQNTTYTAKISKIFYFCCN